MERPSTTSVANLDAFRSDCLAFENYLCGLSWDSAGGAPSHSWSQDMAAMPYTSQPFLSHTNHESEYFNPSLEYSGLPDNGRVTSKKESRAPLPLLRASQSLGAESPGNVEVSIPIHGKIIRFIDKIRDVGSRTGWLRKLIEIARTRSYVNWRMNLVVVRRCINIYSDHIKLSERR